MSTDAAPITPNSSICQTLHCLTEKFVVDFANGIDVARDHLRVQRGRSGIFARMYDGFTGQGARRQGEINAGLTDGVEGSLRWLGELSESLARSNLALAQVNDRVTALTRDVGTLAHYSADTRRQLEEVAHRLDARLQGMAREIARIDFTQKAQLNLDATFYKWSAGRFAALAPAARCYAALEELRWGALGDFCRQHGGERESRTFIGMVADRATAQLEKDAATGQRIPVATAEVWLAVPAGRAEPGSDELREAVAYMADGMTIEDAPFATSVARRPGDLPLAVPLIAPAQRVAEALVYEVFPQGVSDV